MTHLHDIRRRAARRGIACHYIDARGTTVDVRDEILVKLLAGMGEPELDRRLAASEDASCACPQLPNATLLDDQGIVEIAPRATGTTPSHEHCSLTRKEVP